jgi:hypothetical protein
MNDDHPNLPPNPVPPGLTDEQFLAEFVRRFKPDAAVLVYLDNDQESGFARYRNRKGARWGREMFKRLQTTLTNETLDQ